MKVLGLSIVLFLVACQASPYVELTTTDADTVQVYVEVADEPQERQVGLMHRTTLGDDRGMLFIFERERPLSFWMRNTNIPLSIAYIDYQGVIVDIQDMQPLDETPHPSRAPAMYALEVNQGFFKENNISVGSKVLFYLD